MTDKMNTKSYAISNNPFAKHQLCSNQHKSFLTQADKLINYNWLIKRHTQTLTIKTPIRLSNKVTNPKIDLHINLERREDIYEN